MYDEIEKYAAEFDNLRQLLADTRSVVQISAIRQALEATAERIAEIENVNETDRAQLAKLYRGFVAASRVIAHLQERSATRR